MTVAKKETHACQETISEAIHVVEVEANGLKALQKALSSNLAEPFKKLVDAILGVKGRVIISGMGKSGHIANKMAATFASTGTPAFSVHPAEASHGDLGMIAGDDLLILLSNSGETSELSDMMNYAKRYRVPLCGITFNENSTLEKYADHPICLPRLPEACPLGLAPTTTTTVMMAFGDALAVSLLNARGFTSSDFKQFHPGGKLGQRLLKVSDVMDVRENIPLVSEDASAGDVILEMTKKRHGCTGILNHNQELIGVITDGDLRRHLAEGFFELKAKDISSLNPISIPHDWLAIEALRYMNDAKITKAFVYDKKMGNDKKPIGFLNMHTCLDLEVS